MYRKGLIRNFKVNFKFYDVTAWLIKNCNTHVAQYFEMSDFVSHVCLQQFPVSCICHNDLLDLTEVLLNLVVPLDSAVPSIDFEQINIFWTSGFDSVNIVFDLLSVSRSLPELYLPFDLSVASSNLGTINIWFMVLIPLAWHSFPLWFAQFQQKAL